MAFYEALFSVIFNNIDDHRKQQDCLRGVMDLVRKYGEAGQLPIPCSQATIEREKLLDEFDALVDTVGISMELGNKRAHEIIKLLRR